MPENTIAQGKIQIAKQQQAEENRLAQERWRQAEEERRRRQQAALDATIAILNATNQGLAAISGSSSGSSSSGGQGQAGTSGSSSSGGGSSGRTGSSSAPAQKTCTYCHGNRQVYKSDEPNYTGETQVQKWCDICQKNRYPHYHIRCPKCNGTGYEK
jgi:hypothetical protein